MSYYNANCYDNEKAQRLAFVADELLFTNENINLSNGVNFNLYGCTAKQITLGETPTNGVSLSIFNDGGMVGSDYNKEFKAYMGVENSRINKQTFYGTKAYIDHDGEIFQLMNTYPYWKTNCRFGTLSPITSEGYPGKMLWFNGYLYVIYDAIIEGIEAKAYIKYRRMYSGAYGNYEECTTFEQHLLDRIYDEAPYISMVIDEDYFAEYYDVSISDHTTSTAVWNDFRSTTWGAMQSHTWDEYASYCVIQEVRYGVAPYGVWNFSRPRRINDAIINLEGKDRMRLFDTDSTSFIRYNRSLRKGNMTLLEYIQAIASYVGVPVEPNLYAKLNGRRAEIIVDSTQYYSQKSLKDLLSYAFEVCGNNAIIDRYGRLAALSTGSLAYDPDTGEPVEQIPYVYTSDISDYTTPVISCALNFRQGDDVYYEGNTSNPRYEWSDNPFFNKKNPTYSFFGNNWNTKYCGFRESIVTTDADYNLWSDAWVAYKVGNTLNIFPAFTVSVVWNGFGQVTYACYGAVSREYQNYTTRVSAVSNNTDVSLIGFQEASREEKITFSKYGMDVGSNGLRIVNAAGETVFDADEEGNLRIKGHLDGATGTFSGELDAASGKFTGEVVADSGSIGNWEIESNKLVCYKTNDADTKIEMGRNELSGSPHIYLSGKEILNNVSRIIRSRLGYTGRNIYEDNSIKVDVNYSHLPTDNTYYNIHTVDTILDLESNTSINIKGITITLDAPTNASDPSTLEIKNDLVKFANPPWVANVDSTTSGANTVLVSGAYGRKFYVISSLRKNKANIKTIENASEKVDNLRGVSFTSKCEVDDPNTVYYGFIAEEVEKAVPELATYEDGKLRSVQYDRVCALLVEDNKACHRRIEELEKQVKELADAIKELKNEYKHN